MVQDKLWLPGLLKLQTLRDLGFFGRILSVRGEFGYWVFEGDVIPGAAAVLELSQRRRRRNHFGHAVPLALCARQSLRKREGCLVPRRDAHTRAPRRIRQYVTRALPTILPTRLSNSRAASSRISIPHGLSVCAVTTC